MKSFEKPLVRLRGGDSPASCHTHFYSPAPPITHWPPEVAETPEVVVVGAGLSGLTAAYRLRDRQVRVLEAGEAPGGVCLAGEYQGIRYPAGSAYFYYPSTPAWQAWYQELGLDLKDAALAAPTSALFYKGRWFPDCFSQNGLRTLPLAPRELEGLAGFAGDLAALEDQFDLLGAQELPHPEWDAISLAHYLEQVRGFSPEVTRIFTPYCRSCLGGGPEAVSALAAIYFLLSEISPTAASAAFPEGNARLVQALLAALPRPPRVQQTVVQVKPGPDSVQLLVWDRATGDYYRLAAGAVILAVGKFISRRLLTPECGWDPEVFRAFRYSSYLVAALGGAITLAAPGYENWVVGAENFTDFILRPRSAALEGKRVMVLFAPQPPEGRAALLQVRSEDQGRQVLQDLERLFPGTAREVEEVHLFRFGHAQVVPYPGFLTHLKGRLKPRQGRIILAHSDMEGLPSIESAIFQGEQAARLARGVLEGKFEGGQ
ncbi:MAG: FAD-dependent oxidoreductase [Deltaproteobacteria bacterium]|nr:FAD-dependent oxidoreductase [Deltaproteobacteria bacterium]MBI4795263.1 FAD-dependent oxidoreductase [Deltaproteobacteria bacterium]